MDAIVVIVFVVVTFLEWYHVGGLLSTRISPESDYDNLNLNASDSGLHHTVSLMYEGGRHIGFGTTFENKMAAPRFQT
ncbi:hypothetical protein DPMN_046700 [Dreissena polymorpha]|uniref:Uncharacterized protein n=1 Tax=Dreissena polymorpha TaxID=45954 RepID=A0A9D4HYF6_DREPO|nr:hypothetical protein DPMN_046700 [Dreissena polymorpha]